MSTKLKKETASLLSSSPFNYVLKVHNQAGQFIHRTNKLPKYTSRELRVADVENPSLSGGAWVDRDDKNPKKSVVVYDVDFVRNLYDNKSSRDVVLATWSLVAHEWGHVDGELKRNAFTIDNSDEDYANEKMYDIMRRSGFSKDEIDEAYGKYYEVFWKGKQKDRETGIIARDGRGTRTDLDKSWNMTVNPWDPGYKKCDSKKENCKK